MKLAEYRRWLAMARRYSRRSGEAEDLLQEALLVAIRENRMDFELEENRRWFTGVLRNKAAMIARSEERRKRRERLVQSGEQIQPTDAPTSPAFLDQLPPSAAKLAALILHGLTRSETMFALNLSGTAYRQRLVAIRRSLSRLSPEVRAETMALAYYRGRDDVENLEFGLIRRALLRGIRFRSEVGTHDPDGHLILIRAPDPRDAGTE